MITLKIDVTKLDKARFFQGKPDKNGHAPLFCDLVLIERKEVGKFGDTHIVKQSVSKAEREAKVEMPIIGSATDRGSRQRRQEPSYSPDLPAGCEAPARASATTPAIQAMDDDVPFWV